jgi:cytochrome c
MCAQGLKALIAIPTLKKVLRTTFRRGSRNPIFAVAEKILLERMCGQCHAVGVKGRSPHVDAPPFRTFSDETLYDDNFVQRLHKGLITGHPDMPTFKFNWDDASEAVNYLKSIQEHRKSK